MLERIVFVEVALGYLGDPLCYSIEYYRLQLVRQALPAGAAMTRPPISL